MTVPTATLRAEYHPTNPPKLIGFHVIVDSKPVAVIPIDEMVRAAYLSGLAANLQGHPDD
ncbi:hypothetical protein [Bradyrhizobium lablabi]|uniref:hypothetical protein n=1 Tax=Bradyrhizobium lablabi TaxID=722472 RepID=UPI001BA632D1|nr:hypothetical protein [Bradyrhizobium lablabi]MBR0693653.1 hypothetical protein [Bradyrhizobium lablabi]